MFGRSRIEKIAKTFSKAVFGLQRQMASFMNNKNGSLIHDIKEELLASLFTTFKRALLLQFREALDQRPIDHKNEFSKSRGFPFSLYSCSFLHGLSSVELPIRLELWQKKRGLSKVTFLLKAF